MKKALRTVILVDWDNLFVRAKELGKLVTPASLTATIREVCRRCNMRQITEPFVFVTLKSRSEGLYPINLMDALARQNFTVIVTEVEKDAADHRLRKIAELTWDDTDSIVVLSADTGFAGISKTYQSHDAEVVIAAFGEISPRLRKVATRAFDLAYSLDFNTAAVVRDCLAYAKEGKVPEDGSLVLGAHRVMIQHVAKVARDIASNSVSLSRVVEKATEGLKGLPFSEDDIKVICEELRAVDVLVPKSLRRIAFHATPVSEFILQSF